MNNACIFIKMNLKCSCKYQKGCFFVLNNFKDERKLVTNDPVTLALHFMVVGGPGLNLQ